MNTQKVSISVVIITLNEEKNIGRCLDSVSGVADDIVVVDSFSTDRTEEISLQKGARFIQNKFEGHIEQQQFALKQAKYDIVLALDADEALSETLKKEILKVKQDWKIDGYYMNRLTNYCGKWIRYSGWYPDKKLRLWNRKKGSWSGINPHYEVLMLKNSKIGHLKGDLLHYSYYSIDEHIKQMNYFTSIMAKDYLEKGKKGSLLKIIFSPIFKFLKSYFAQLGILDGFAGLIVCTISAHATFVKYVKLKMLQREKNS